MSNNEDKLILKPYRITASNVPNSIRNKLGYDTASLRDVIEECHGIIYRTTFDYVLEFESLAQYNWFLIRYS
jgi:hypothetical protein